MRVVVSARVVGAFTGKLVESLVSLMKECDRGAPLTIVARLDVSTMGAVVAPDAGAEDETEARTSSSSLLSGTITTIVSQRAPSLSGTTMLFCGAGVGAGEAGVDDDETTASLAV